MGTTKFSTVKDALLPTLAQIWRNGLSTIFFLLSPSTAAATVYILEQQALNPSPLKHLDRHTNLKCFVLKHSSSQQNMCRQGFVRQIKCLNGPETS